MRRLFCKLLLFYFFLSTVFVPEGDFTLLAQLPALYRHCRSTEDRDLNIIDFITDHLINIDGIFDKHRAGDDQKPHQPFQYEHLQHMIAYEAAYLSINVTAPLFELNAIHLLKASSFHSDYIAYIFHPPDTGLHYHGDLYL